MSRPWTSQPYFRGAGAFYKGFSRGAIGLLCATMLASCGQSTPAGYPGSSESSIQTGTLQPLIVPPNAENRPPVPGTTGAAKTADGLPALHALGNNTALFSSRMSREVDRLDRLENAVQELRNDFDAMAPAIVRLVAIEGDIQNLIQQLEMLTGDSMPAVSAPSIEEQPLAASPYYETQGVPDLPPISSDPALAPHNILPNDYPAEDSAELAELQADAQMAAVAAKAATADVPPNPTQTQITKAQTGTQAKTSSVMDIRIGEHPGKTRIVLDTRGKTSFTADLDNQEKILVIEIPNAEWNAATQQNFANAPLLSSYRIEQNGNAGIMLIVQIKKAATISYKGVMDEPKTGGQRLIIDLSATR